MRYAIDAHAIGRNLTGNEVYARSLLREFATLEDPSSFVAVLSEKSAVASVPGGMSVRYVSRNPWLRLGWQLSSEVQREGAALLHVQYTAPLFCPVPSVVTVHDVSFIEHPEYFSGSRAPQLRLTVANSVRSAASVITVSDFSRQRILNAFDIPGERVKVIPNAADPVFRVTGRERAGREVEETFRFGAPFVLSVGDLQPRKNQIGLIRGFERLIAGNPQLPHHLVLAGQPTGFAEQIRAVAQKSEVAQRIHFTGFVDEADLVRLYNAADCFVFPSFYEGFGIPILEAMACGRAVACSNTTAMPEVADGAGLFFNPSDAADIARAMADILLDSELRMRMERLGLQRAASFSWRAAAAATLDVYREVAGVRKAAGLARAAVAGS